MWLYIYIIYISINYYLREDSLTTGLVQVLPSAVFTVKTRIILSFPGYTSIILANDHNVGRKLSSVRSTKSSTEKACLSFCKKSDLYKTDLLSNRGSGGETIGSPIKK